MSKIRTENQLQDILDKEFSWRFKENLHMLDSVRVAQGQIRNTLIRASLAVLYAHWEGFVKKCSEAFLAFVMNQNIPNNKLQNCFWALALKKHVRNFGDSKQMKCHVEAVEFIKESMQVSTRFNLKKAIDAESNLKYDVLLNILNTIGLDHNKYSTKENFINSDLLANRNGIVHGEWLMVNLESFEEINKGVISLMRQIKSDIEESVTNKLYVEEEFRLY